MSQFTLSTESIRTPALTLEYCLVPWDTEIVGLPVAQITNLRVAEPTQAVRDYEPFAEWCLRSRIALCACRLPSERLIESIFLEDAGFRFVELNYHPIVTDLRAFDTPDEEITVTHADESDRTTFSALAAETFIHGRFHQDPRVGKTLGDRRYGAWMSNAFENDHQTVIKCTMKNELVAFFVIQTAEPDHIFWSLVGIPPILRGSGLGKRVWRAMLNWHLRNGIHTVSTSISSHNVAAHNLYVSLGFRFPQPDITLHWCPTGPLF